MNALGLGQVSTAFKGKNLDPKTCDQHFPKRLLEMQELSKRYEQTLRMQKKRNFRNRVFEESRRAGFEKCNFEDANQLVNRVCAITTKEIKEKRMLAKYDLAGRDMREVEADYKRMKESLEGRRRKAIKKETGESNKSNTDEERNDYKRSHEREKLIRTKVKRKSRKEAYRELRRVAEANERNNMILDAKEVVAFGSRVDAPPMFAPAQRQALKSAFTKAGRKPLLLKAKLKAQIERTHEETERCNTSDAKERSGTIAAERSRVITAYRMMKKIRRNLAC